MPDEKQDDAAMKAYKERVNAVVGRLKTDLKDWIHQHDGDDMFGDPPGEITSAHNAVEVTSALLETAFERRAKVLRRRFQ